MGTDEDRLPTKSSKPTASQVVKTPTTPSYPDWSTSVQAYYGAGATLPHFYTSSVVPPPPHSYMWGNQHPMLPPYGTPLPYPALYPHGALYAPPNMAMAQGVALTNSESEVKAPDGKGLMSMEKSKGTLGNMGFTDGKSGENGKAASGSGNDGASQSDGSACEGSSDESDGNATQQASSATKKRSFNQLLAEANANRNNAMQYNGGNPLAPVPGKLDMPSTNLTTAMDLWNASPVGATPMRSKTNASGASFPVAPATTTGCEGILRDHPWTQGERELKREKRKQSNRESARRSRFRKQVECEELQVKVDNLINENRTLREELHRIAEECEKLTSENNSLMEESTHLHRPDATSSLHGSYRDTALHSVNGEDNSHGQDTSAENNSVSGQNGGFFNYNGKQDS